MRGTALFGPTHRLLFLSVVVGLVGALAAFAIEGLVELTRGALLDRVNDPADWVRGQGLLAGRFPIPRSRLWLPLVTTLGGLLSGLIVYRWAPETEGHGTDAAIGAYHNEAGSLRSRVPFVKAITAALTLGSGGVAGKEGPAAQISVGLGAILARWSGLRGQERRTLLLASMAAGLAAIFHAPLGMAIFAVEILYSGMVFEAEALIYTVIAAVTSYALYGAFAGWEPLFDVPELTFQEPLALLSFAVLGAAAGLVGAFLPALLYRVQAFFRWIPGPPHIKPALGGLVVGLVAVVFPEVLGAGYEWVRAGMENELTLTAALLVFLLKGPAMAVTIGSGGSGGVFGPTVTLGAMLGAIVGLTLSSWGLAGGIPVAGFVVVGMAAVFAGAARTPISTLIMVAEMTGDYGFIVPAMLANVTAFLVQRRLTQTSRYSQLYQAQVENRELSPLHRSVFVRRGLEILDKEPFDASQIRLPRLVSLLRFGEPVPVSGGDHGFNLVSLPISVGSELDGGTVAETVGKVEGATAVAILTGEEMVAPRGGSILRGGDQLLLVSDEEAFEKLKGLAMSSSDSDIQ